MQGAVCRPQSSAGKRRNAADAPSKHNPSGRRRLGASRRCGGLSWNNHCLRRRA